PAEHRDAHPPRRLSRGCHRDRRALRLYSLRRAAAPCRARLSRPCGGDAARLLGCVPRNAWAGGAPRAADDAGEASLSPLRLSAGRRPPPRPRIGGRAAARPRCGGCPGHHPDAAETALAQRRPRRRHGARGGDAADCGVRWRSIMTASPATTERQERAAAWFAALRDRICAAFEAIEDEYAALRPAEGSAG